MSQQSDKAPMKPVLVNGETVGFIHFNGTLIKNNSYIAQLTLELLRPLDPIRTLKAIEENQAVDEAKFLFRNDPRGNNLWFIQFEYDSKGSYVGKPRSFLNARCRWLAVALTKAMR